MGKKFANVCCGAGAGRGRGGGGRGARWRACCSCTRGTKLAHQYTVLVLSSAQWKIVNRCKQLIMNNLTSVHVCLVLAALGRRPNPI